MRENYHEFFSILNLRRTSCSSWNSVLLLNGKFGSTNLIQPVRSFETKNTLRQIEKNFNFTFLIRTLKKAKTKFCSFSKDKISAPVNNELFSNIKSNDMYMYMLKPPM